MAGAFRDVAWADVGVHDAVSEPPAVEDVGELLEAVEGLEGRAFEMVAFACENGDSGGEVDVFEGGTGGQRGAADARRRLLLLLGRVLRRGVLGAGAKAHRRVVVRLQFVR